MDPTDQGELVLRVLGRARNWAEMVDEYLYHECMPHIQIQANPSPVPHADPTTFRS